MIDRNVEYGTSLFNLNYGSGFWLILKKSQKLSLEGGIQFDNGKPIELTLYHGWNQIGNPYYFTINWPYILSYNNLNERDDIISQQFIVYKKDNMGNIGYDSAANLTEFNGAFVELKTGTQLTLVIPNTMPALRQSKIETDNFKIFNNELKSTEWYLPIDIYQNGLMNKLGGIGMRDGAKVGYDDYDSKQIPRFMNYVDIDFTVNQGQIEHLSSSIVPVNENYRWDLKAETNKVNLPLMIKWDSKLVSGLPNDLYLFNPNTSDLINMKEENNYVFTSKENSFLSILYGNNQYIRRQISEENFLLGKPFPNPFKNQVTVQGIIPELMKINATIDVYNLQGQLVFHSDKFTLNQETGIIKFSWDGLNSSGNEVSNGFYNIIIIWKDNKGILRYFSKKIIKN